MKSASWVGLFLMCISCAHVQKGIFPIVETKADIARSLYPTSVGLKWTYQVEPGSTACNPGKFEVQVRDRWFEDDVTYFQRDNVCDHLGKNADREWISNDEVTSVSNPVPSTFLSSPVEEGHSWDTNRTVKAKWKKIGPAKVKAGTFTDCWKVIYSPGVIETTLCRGIGIVQSISEEFGLKYELLSFDFSSIKE